MSGIQEQVSETQQGRGLVNRQLLFVAITATLCMNVKTCAFTSENYYTCAENQCQSCAQ